MLTKDQLLGAKDRLKTQTVEIPELGGQVVVRELNTKQRNIIEAGVVMDKQKALSDMRSQIVVWSVMNGDGPMFTEADTARIGELPSSVTTPIVNVAMELSGFSQADQDELEKNSDASS